MNWLSRIGSLALLLVLASCASVRVKPAKSSGIQMAAEAWQRMAEDGPDSSAEAAYRTGVAAVLEEMVELGMPNEWPAQCRLSNGWTVRVNGGSAKSPEVWTPKLFDELKVPEKKPKSDVPGALRDGLGLPVDGLRVDEEEDSQSRFVYQGKQNLPVTAVLEFGAAPKTATLHLYDPRELQSVRVGRRSIPLAADFVTSVHALLDRRSFVRRALGGLLRPGRFWDDEGLFIQEPYRADKIPIVLVHGLMSDPHIWENVIVAIRSDPELGKRVQCWCYMYPSGLPVPVSSARLRQSLQEADKILDPEKDDPGMNRTMLVGHSMGGLLSRMQVIDSGLDFWHTWFTRTPEQVPLDGAAGRMMRSSLLFNANSRVKRVVFIATPHRGSEVADGWIGHLGSKLIRAPMQLVQTLTSLATLDVDLINPSRFEMNRLGADSINGLSTKHPVLQAMATRPMKVPCHSIIAVIKDKPSLAETSDGIVPYRSSHLDEAKTEVTVKSGHSCTKKLETVEAVKNLVRRHLSAVR